jgi:hypothetical protein
MQEMSFIAIHLFEIFVTATKCAENIWNLETKKLIRVDITIKYVKEKCYFYFHLYDVSGYAYPTYGGSPHLFNQIQGPLVVPW